MSFNALIQQIIEGDSRAQTEATYALKSSFGRYADRIMAEIKHQNLNVRRAIIAVLYTQDDLHVVDPLLTALEDEDAYVRQHAILKLGKLRDSRAFSLLLHISQHDSQQVLRSDALEALGMIGDPQAYDVLSTALQDPVTAVRRAALRGLGHLNDIRALPGLLAALDDKDRNVVITAINALGVSSCPGAVNALIPLLHHKSSVLRREAAFALSKIDDPRATQALIPLLWKRNKDVFPQVAYSLALRRTTEAVDALVVALEDNRGRISEFAAFALDEMHDPDAAEALVGLLNDRRLDLVARAYPFYIRKGIEGSEDVLIEALNQHGAYGMADAFICSGNAKLEAAGRAFHERKDSTPGKTMPGEEKWRPLWGSEPY